MSLERARQSVARLREIAAGRACLAAPPLTIDPGLARELFDSQLLARLVDVESHELRARGQGFYTICSAGHEGNVVLGRLTAPTDPALLHYRSAAFFVERARQRPAIDPVFDLLLSLAASSDDPISGGRHKVFGSVPLGIPPQTSTIASHLPKAVGLAVALEQARRLDRPAAPADAIVVCSFGDASLNHSTAQGALNAAAWTAFQHLPVPVLFVCEDNGLGISVRTPPGWVEARMKAMPNLRYFQTDGCDIGAAFTTARAAIEHVRAKRMPAFLRLATVRLWGHAGSDLDTEYRSAAEIAAQEARDPVARSAQSLLDAAAFTGSELSERIDAAEHRVREASARAIARPKLAAREEVMRSLAPSRPALVAVEARRGGYAAPPETATRAKPMGLAIREGLHDLMKKHAEMLIFGEDVAQKGGVYGVTVGLWKAFGPKRVFNTLLDEQTILGMALGAGQAGLLPVPEIQFLAYLHNAEDQLRGEAATLSFFSDGQMKNPMVVRIAGLGYQKGFGGHFHNDDSLAVLRDLPGVIVAVPSRGDDGVRLMRTLLAHAKIDGRVCVIVEPIALYPVKDLYEANDGAWSFPFPPHGEAIDVGEVGVYDPEATDLCVFTYGNGVPMSLRVKRRIESAAISIGDARAPRVRVVDLRWIAPLPLTAIREHARSSRAVLVADECRHSGNVAEAIGAALAEDPATRGVPYARVSSADSFIPLAAAAERVLLSEAEIESAARALLDGQPR